MARIKDESGVAVDELRAFGLRYPGAHTKSPWPGHLDLAVKDKTFAYLSVAGEPLTISCKLPRSAEAALSLPFTTPTAYGLGKSGWVTATFPDGTPIPVDLLREWIDESYRAQAPKRLSAGLPALDAAASSEEPVLLAKPARAVAPRAARKKVGKPAGRQAAAVKAASAKPAAVRAAKSAAVKSASAKARSKPAAARAGLAKRGTAKRNGASKTGAAGRGRPAARSKQG